MVWSAIGYTSRSPFVSIDGPLYSACNISGVLRSMTLLFIRALRNPTFKQDNACPHVVSIVQDFLAEVAQGIGVSQSVISRIWNRFLETGSAGRRPGQGRRRATTPNEDRYLKLTARRHRNMNDTLLQPHLRSATGTTVSTQTVRNEVHDVGVFSSGGTVAVEVILRSCTKVSDLVVGVCWCMVASPLRGAQTSTLVRDGPLTARRHRDEILRPIVVPYAAAIGDDFILMDDNCSPYRANLVEDFLFEEGIVQMEWPACSPDINPIEHVWDALGRRVAGREPPPQTLQELERAILEEWDRMP
ncbi:transposable element Tcb2 transposase [Trichonephila clavipes]|nr:transposable element Tcb2 transposase [Trichonephila clavipes]